MQQSVTVDHKIRASFVAFSSEVTLFLYCSEFGPFVGLWLCDVVILCFKTLEILSDLWLSRLISIPGSSCFSSQNRGDPRDPRGSLVVTWRREVGLPGPQRQPGAQHGSTSLHRHDVPQRKAVPVPEGKHYTEDTPFPSRQIWRARLSVVIFGTWACLLYFQEWDEEIDIVLFRTCYAP